MDRFIFIVYTIEIINISLSEHWNMSEHWVFYFTDGARRKENRSMGSSIIIIAYSISLLKMCSIFTAKAFAIKMALEANAILEVRI